MPTSTKEVSSRAPQQTSNAERLDCASFVSAHRDFAPDAIGAFRFVANSL